MPRPINKAELLEQCRKNFDALFDFVNGFSEEEQEKEIQAKYSERDLAAAKKLLHPSFKKLFNIIKKHSYEELFTKKKYHCTGSTSSGAYLTTAASSHYDWAFKHIKRAKSEE